MRDKCAKCDKKNNCKSYNEKLGYIPCPKKCSIGIKVMTGIKP